MDTPDLNRMSQIEAAIQEADRVVVLLSRNSMNSPWVRTEIEWALAAKKIVPVALDPPSEFRSSLPNAFRSLPILERNRGYSDGRVLMRALGAEKRKARVSFTAAKVDVSKLPTTCDRLIGRAKELERLQKAWDGQSKPIVALTGIGGVGKTAVVDHFVKGHETEWLARSSLCVCVGVSTQDTNADRT